MFRLLAANRTRMCVCEFVDSLGERQYNVSRHLKVLGLAGLLRKEKEGRRAYYALDAVFPAISAFSRLVVSLPDPDGTFAKDQESFEEQMRYRQGGDRCRQCTERRKGGGSGGGPVIDRVRVGREPSNRVAGRKAL